jgi:hypothetical protein
MNPTTTSTTTRHSDDDVTLAPPIRLAGDLDSSGSYKLPVLGVTLPRGLVEKGFWGALVGSAVLGAVDPPLAALVGAGVIIARHRPR